MAVNRLCLAADREGKVPLLAELDFHLPPGTLTLLVGRTGSGKTSLLHALGGLKAPVSGQVLYGNEPLWLERGRGQRTHRRRNVDVSSRLGILLQQPEQQLFAPTVERELRYGLARLRLGREEEKSRMESALAQVHLDPSVLAESPFAFSGGEKRRIALASVLAVDPDWLLLDEPSSGLDPAEARQLIGILAQAKAKRATCGGLIIATHDVDLFWPIADYILLLDSQPSARLFTPEQLVREPERWEQAGVGIPEWVQWEAWMRGVDTGAWPTDTDARPVSEGHPAAAMMSPDGMAGASGQLRTTATDEPKDGTVGNLTENGVSGTSAVTAAESRLHRMDPMVKWAFLCGFSLIMILFSHAYVSLAGILTMFALQSGLGVPLRRTGKLLKPYVWFMALAFGIAGFDWNGFEWGEGWETVRLLLPFLPVMMAGFLFTETTSPQQIGNVVYRLAGAIPFIRRGAETISLAVSLLFRFVLLISAELERFAMIAQARTNTRSAPGTLPLRQLPLFLIPLLLALLQQAEQLSQAMEARGYWPGRHRDEG